MLHLRLCAVALADTEYESDGALFCPHLLTFGWTLIPVADVMTPAQRSALMSRISGRNTKPELMVRALLWRRGFRFRLHGKQLPGHPDIVLPRWNTVVFVHGCFWHYHDCPLFRLPATRPEFWKDKLEQNRLRDTRTVAALRERGWRVGVVWECAVRLDAEGVAALLEDWIRGKGARIDVARANQGPPLSQKLIVGVVTEA